MFIICLVMQLFMRKHFCRRGDNVEVSGLSIADYCSPKQSFSLCCVNCEQSRVQDHFKYKINNYNHCHYDESSLQTVRDIIEVFKLLILSDQHSENPNIKLTLIQHKDS